jgi:hypothetical protein
MSIQPASRFFGLLALAVALSAGVAAAQIVPMTVPVPVDRFTHTLSLPMSDDAFYSGVNKIIVKTSDGISHVVDVTPDTEPNGETPSLRSLRPGTPVAVRYTVKGIQASTDEIDRVGPDGLNLNEGVVTAVDKGRRQITLRLSNGTTQTLRLTQHAANDPHTLRGSRVFVYYSDELGQRVARSFRPVH